MKGYTVEPDGPGLRVTRDADGVDLGLYATQEDVKRVVEHDRTVPPARSRTKVDRRIASPPPEPVND